MEDSLPKHYKALKEFNPQYIEAVEKMGAELRKGPIKEKEQHLIQLAAAAAIRSEGAVHSHARRALAAGATKDEVLHTMVILTSTIGFPQVSAAISWIRDIPGMS